MAGTGRPTRPARLSAPPGERPAVRWPGGRAAPCTVAAWPPTRCRAARPGSRLFTKDADGDIADREADPETRATPTKRRQWPVASGKTSGKTGQTQTQTQADRRGTANCPASPMASRTISAGAGQLTSSLMARPEGDPDPVNRITQPGRGNHSGPGLPPGSNRSFPFASRGAGAGACTSPNTSAIAATAGRARAGRPSRQSVSIAPRASESRTPQLMSSSVRSAGDLS